MKNYEGIHCISLDSNDQISKFKKADLDELLREIKYYYINYREILNLPSNVTFGMEIEFEKSYLKTIEYLIDKELNIENSNNCWISKEESTTMGNTKIGGGEVCTPIMTDNSNSWNDLLRAINILQMCNAESLNRSASHIHIGAHVLSSTDWFNLFKIWMLYEKIIFRFSYGEKLKPRSEIYDYSFPLSDKFNFYLFRNEQIKSIRDFYLNSRNWSLNLSNIRLESYNNHTFANRNTIEVRCPNGTLNPIIWQNNVNFFTKLILYAKKCDLDFINDKLNHYKDKDGNFKLYNKIYLNDALQLCDMIFDNNLDKVNFLKQYLKDFKERNNIPCNSKVIKLTK